MIVTHTLSPTDVVTVEAINPKTAYIEVCKKRNVFHISELNSSDFYWKATAEEMEKWKRDDFYN